MSGSSVNGSPGLPDTEWGNFQASAEAGSAGEHEPGHAGDRAVEEALDERLREPDLGPHHARRATSASMPSVAPRVGSNGLSRVSRT